MGLGRTAPDPSTPPWTLRSEEASTKVSAPRETDAFPPTPSAVPVPPLSATLRVEALLNETVPAPKIASPAVGAGAFRAADHVDGTRVHQESTGHPEVRGTAIGQDVHFGSMTQGRETQGSGGSSANEENLAGIRRNFAPTAKFADPAVPEETMRVEAPANKAEPKVTEASPSNPLTVPIPPYPAGR